MQNTDFFLHLRTILSQYITGPGSQATISVILIFGIAFCAVVGYYVTRLLLTIVEKAVARTSTTWDDDLLNAKLLKAVSQLTPALVVSWMLPRCFASQLNSVHWLDVLTSFYILWASIYTVTVFLDNLLHAFSHRPRFRPYAVKGIFQMVKLIAIGIGVIIGLSLVIGKTPVAIITALGASAAVLMLVFKDTILGLVASVQLTANKMLHKGDWIVVPGHDANGEVIDISLTTVKIRNWDNSVTTVPPYSLISESFRNYQPMQKSKGRRISRSIYIDINSVRFLSQEQLKSLSDGGWVKPAAEGEEIKSVNLALFRDYLEGWLRSLPQVRKDMTLMVRQLEPTQSGLPVELYCFTDIIEWTAYERFQADIFNHVYASVSKFGLTIFQSPSGLDISRR